MLDIDIGCIFCTFLSVLVFCASNWPQEVSLALWVHRLLNVSCCLKQFTQLTASKLLTIQVLLAFRRAIVLLPTAIKLNPFVGT